MNTAQTATGSTRAVPASRPQLHTVCDSARARLDEAQSLVYRARGLVAGARLLAARPRLCAEDQALRRQSAHQARHALAALECCSRVFAEITDRLMSEQLVALWCALDAAHGHLAAAVSLLDATQARDESDECLQALDLYGMALDLAKPIHAALRAAMGDVPAQVAA